MEPIARHELYLAAAAGQDVTPPDPVTRLEKFLAALIEHIASSGGGSNTFIMTVTLEEEVNSVEITLPVAVNKLLIANFHFTLPGLLSELYLYGVTSHKTKGFGAITASDSEAYESGANIYVLRWCDNQMFSRFTTAKNYANNARPGALTANFECGGSEVITFYSNTSGVNFPAGTVINIWGVYSE